ncbi:MAG: hemolysin III family protein, partial [Firmicutes bacterium]|nr:hemolysin III family protein [Bacillota bacterium]
IMVWSIIMVIKDVIAALPAAGFWLLLLGGIAYTGGLVFYAIKKKYMHSIWHLFVLTGSLLHYLCIAIYVLPMAY